MAKRQTANPEGLAAAVCLKEVIIEVGLCFCRSFSVFFCRCISSRSLCGLGFSLCGSFGGFLLCYFLSDLFIDFLLSLQTSFGCSLLVGCQFGGESFQALLLVFLPSLELGLGGSLVKSSLLHTTAEMLHHVDTFLGQDVADRVCRLCADFHPIESAVEFQIYSGGIGVRVVRANLFCKLTITWCSYVCNDDAVKGML